jgi:TPR repeat protein
MVLLGKSLIDGKNGFEQDVESGVAWLKKSVESASEQYPHGLYELALLYQSGKVDPIVPKNTEIMLELLEKGKSLNSCQSFLFMAKIYENGDYGVEKSYDTAYRHYLSASKTSIEVILVKLGKVSSGLFYG